MKWWMWYWLVVAVLSFVHFMQWGHWSSILVDAWIALMIYVPVWLVVWVVRAGRKPQQEVIPK